MAVSGLNENNLHLDSTTTTLVSNNSIDNATTATTTTSGGCASDSISKHLEQRDWRVRELIESENDYVSDLGQCCQYIEFMRETKEEENPEIPMPPDLKQGKDRMIFGNMENIYEWHRE